jgi:phosphoribosyl 1,2-cyclic phosphate phosphodiesterase
MELTFLGTGGAWGLPELNCHCRICSEMRRNGERRERTAFLLSGNQTVLMDCGPDIASGLARNHVTKIDAVLLTHEHGDHYMGLDELFAYKRTLPRGTFDPIPVYATERSWLVIMQRFQYLEAMAVIKPQIVEPDTDLLIGDLRIVPFRTHHGNFAAGSVGYAIQWEDDRRTTRLVYTSDFMDLPSLRPALINPDYLIIQSFWLNEPVSNRPHHMSFQRAIDYIKRINPTREVFLVHMGDGDMVPGDLANTMLKKVEARDPLRDGRGAPYPIPLNQAQWQQTVVKIGSDRGLPYKIAVAFDDLTVPL